MGLEYQLEVAKQAVLEAGKLVKGKYDNKTFVSEYKSDGSPVTTADKEAETKVRKIIYDAFPNNGFIGEEFEPFIGSDGYIWYNDPIDGTWCIINGEKTASTSLALSKDGKTILSVVYNFMTDELFTAANGLPTELNGKPIPNYNRTNLDEAVFNFQISPRRPDDVYELFKLWEKDSFAKLISRGGSIAYNLAQVAEGSHSVYIAASTKTSEPWDIAGGVYLIESVGGKVSQHDDGKILIAATNPIIHQKTLDLLSKTNFGKRKQ